MGIFQRRGNAHPRRVFYSGLSTQLTNPKLVVCLYSRSGGQGGKHNAVADSSNITALLHVGVQVFEHAHSRWFTQFPVKTAQLHTKQFALLSPRNLLLCLHAAVEEDETQLVQVSQNDFIEFKNMSEGAMDIKKALHKYEGE